MKKPVRRPSMIFGRAASGLPSLREISVTIARSASTLSAGTSSRARYSGLANAMCWAMLRAVSASVPL